MKIERLKRKIIRCGKKERNISYILDYKSKFD